MGPPYRVEATRIWRNLIMRAADCESAPPRRYLWIFDDLRPDEPHMSSPGSLPRANFCGMPRPALLLASVALACAACSSNLETSLQRLVEARRLSADLLVQFNRVVDSGN